LTGVDVDLVGVLDPTALLFAGLVVVVFNLWREWQNGRRPG
jgi:hypothetical protein